MTNRENFIKAIKIYAKMRIYTNSFFDAFMEEAVLDGKQLTVFGDEFVHDMYSFVRSEIISHDETILSFMTIPLVLEMPSLNGRLKLLDNSDLITFYSVNFERGKVFITIYDKAAVNLYKLANKDLDTFFKLLDKEGSNG